MKYFVPYILLLVFVFGAILAVQPAFAQSPFSGTPSTPTAENQGWLGNLSADCLSKGDCTMEDMVQLVVNLINFLLGAAGVIAMFFFALGGFTWITSFGSEEKVASGTKMIEGALVGIFIVLAAWIFVSFVLTDWLGLKVSPGLRVDISQPSTSPKPQ